MNFKKICRKLGATLCACLALWVSNTPAMANPSQFIMDFKNTLYGGEIDSTQLEAIEKVFEVGEEESYFEIRDERLIPIIFWYNEDMGMFKLSFDFKNINKEKGIVGTDYLPFSYFASMVQGVFIDAGYKFVDYNDMLAKDKAKFLSVIFNSILGMTWIDSYYHGKDFSELKECISGIDLKESFYDTFKRRMAFNQKVEKLDYVKDLKKNFDTEKEKLSRSARNKMLGCSIAALLVGGGVGVGVGYPIWTKKDENKDSKKHDIKVNLEKENKKTPGKFRSKGIKRNRRNKIREVKLSNKKRTV